MRRFIILVLALAIARSAMAAPAHGCVAMDDAIAAEPHACCERAIRAAPIEPCCIVTAPVQRLSSTEIRLAAPDQVLVIPRTADGLLGFVRNRTGCPSPPIPRGAPVPLYLQQLSLLI